MTAHSVSVRKDKGMAKVYARGNKLHIDYVVDGERKRKATGLDDTKENRKLVEKTIIPKLNSMIATGEIHKKKPKNFGYYFEIFLKRKSMLRSYSKKIDQWNITNNFFKDTDIDKITRLDLKNFLFDLPIKAISKKPYRVCLIQVFEMAIDDGVIRTNPALNISLPQEEKKDITYFSKDEVKIILKNAEGVMKPFLYLALNTGMRPEEILGLQMGDIQDGKIDIKRVRTCGKITHPKTRKSIRRIPCPDFVIEEVKKYQSDNIFIFGKFDDVAKLRYKWVMLLKKCEIEYRKMYSCRHTYATMMLLSGIVSLNELAGLLGHSTPAITLSYYASAIDAKTIDLGKDFDLFDTNTSQSINLSQQRSQNRA